MASPSETKPGPVEVEHAGRGLSHSTFIAFRSKPFVLLWGNTFSFALSQSIQLFTFAWLALDLAKDGVELWTGFTIQSGSAVGLVIFSLGLPMLLFGLYAGILADRVDRRLLLFGSQLASIAITATAAAFAAMGSLDIWTTLGFAFLLGSSIAFGLPVRQAIVPSLVTPERVLNAVTLMNLGGQASQMAGAFISGAFIAWGGIELAFAVQAGLLLLGLFALIPLRVPRVRESAPRQMREDLREGFAFVARHAGIRTLMIALLATALVMSGTFQALLPKIAREDLGAGPLLSSLLFGAMSVGVLITSLALATVTRLDRAGLYFLLTLVVGGALNVALGLAPTYILAFVIMFITGWNAGIFINLNMALVQAHTPNAVMGRVMSIYNMCMVGAMPLSALVAGLMADVVGAGEWFTICGAALLLVGVTVLATQPTLRRMSSAPDPARNAVPVAGG